MGEGALISHGHTMGYYRTIAASYCKPESKNSAMRFFFMHNGDLDYRRKSRGWENTLWAKHCDCRYRNGQVADHDYATRRVYALIFSQRGLMAGLGLTGIKDNGDSSGINGGYGEIGTNEIVRRP